MPFQWSASQQQDWQAQSDVAGTFASLRSLGNGSRQAASGDHAHNLLNILNYGADKDGVRNSDWAIQAAMADANSRKMAGIYSPVEGTFLISIALDPPDGTTVAGTGWGTIFKMAPSANLTGVFYSTSKRERVTIRDLTVDGNSANNASGDGIRMHLKWSHIWRVKFQNIKDKAIYLAPTSVSIDSALLNVVAFCEVMDSTYGIYWDYPLGDSWIMYNNIGSATANIRGAGGPNRIIGNHCDGAGTNRPTYNVQFETAGSNNLIQSNLFEGANRSAIFILEINYNPTFHPSADFNISNNLIKNASKIADNTYSMIHLEGYSSVRQLIRVNITDNTFITDDAGTNPKYNVYMKNVDGVIITGNTYQPVGTTPWKIDGVSASTDDGAVASADGIVINANVDIRHNSPADWPEETRTTADTNVSNTVAETALASFTVVGGDLLTNKRIRITIDGDLLYNNNVADTLTIRLKYGVATLVATATAAPGALSATRSQFRLMCELSADGATNAQYGVLHWIVTAPQAMAAGTGGQYGTANYLPQLVGATTAIDSTAGATLAVTVQWSTASLTNSLIARWTLVEMV